MMLKRMSEYYYTTVYTVKCDMTSLHSTSLSHTHTYSHILSLFLSHSLSLRHFYPPAPATVCLFGNQSSFLNRSTAVPGTDGVKERVRNFRGWVRGLKGKHTEERRRQEERERVRRKGGKGEKRVRGETKPQQASLVWGFLAYWRVRTTLVARWVFPPLIEYLHLCVFS